MEAKTIKQILSNLPDEVRDKAILSVILESGHEGLEENLHLSCKGESVEVTALMGSINMNNALGGIDYWTQEILNLRKDLRTIVYVQRNQIDYLMFLYDIAARDLPGSLLEPITLTTQNRKGTISIAIEQKNLQNLIKLGVKVNYNVEFIAGETIYN